MKVRKTKTSTNLYDRMVNLLNARRQCSNENTESLEEHNNETRQLKTCNNSKRDVETAAKRKSTLSAIRKRKKTLSPSKCDNTIANMNKPSNDENVEEHAGDEFQLSRVSAIKTLALLKCKQSKPSAEEKVTSICQAVPNAINWGSPNFIARRVRECILDRRWDIIPHLLKLLMFEDKRYGNFIKEVSYLCFLHHTNRGSDELVREFWNSSFVFVGLEKRRPMFDVWCKNDC